MHNKIYTYNQMISELGEIPYCQCDSNEGKGCGLKVNIKPNKCNSYIYYKNYGYPRFILGHGNIGKNSPTKNKIKTQEQKDKISKSLKKFYQSNPSAKYTNSKALKEYYKLHTEKIKRGKEHWSTEKSPWNKGLTKETDERVKVYAENLKGKSLSQETCNKLSKSHKNKVPWNKGKIECFSKEILELKSKSMKKYYKLHPEAIKMGNEHPMFGKIKELNPAWKGGKKLAKLRAHSKRRQFFKFIPLNECREKNWVGHHIDFEYVIFIPEKLHTSVSHSVINNKNMDIINDKVYDWFIKYYMKNNNGE